MSVCVRSYQRVVMNATATDRTFWLRLRHLRTAIMCIEGQAHIGRGASHGAFGMGVHLAVPLLRDVTDSMKIDMCSEGSRSSTDTSD